MSVCCLDFTKLLIISHLNSQLNDSLADDEDRKNKEINDKLLEKKVEEFNFLITTHLSKIEGVSDKDIKLIDDESIQWIEKLVSVDLETRCL